MRPGNLIRSIRFLLNQLPTTTKLPLILGHLQVYRASQGGTGLPDFRVFIFPILPPPSATASHGMELPGTHFPDLVPEILVLDERKNIAIKIRDR